jgi:hypothetical protein
VPVFSVSLKPQHGHRCRLLLLAILLLQPLLLRQSVLLLLPQQKKPAATKKSAVTTISVEAGTSSVPATNQQPVRFNNETTGLATESFEDPGCCQACRAMCGRLSEKCKSAAQRRLPKPPGTSTTATDYQQLHSPRSPLALLHSNLKGQRHDLTNSPTELRQIIQARYEIQRNTRNTL